MLVFLYLVNSPNEIIVITFYYLTDVITLFDIIFRVFTKFNIFILLKRIPRKACRFISI
jgi:hypothetical protein